MLQLVTREATLEADDRDSFITNLLDMISHLNFGDKGGR